MFVRIALSAALVGTAAAFAPLMSMDVDRRSVVHAGSVAAAAAPLLRSSPASAAGRGSPNRAPVITIFDHRGCNRGGPNKEYTGAMAGGSDDEMCVKVQSSVIRLNENFGSNFLAEAIGMKEKAIDGPYTSQIGRRNGDGVSIVPY